MEEKASSARVALKYGVIIAILIMIYSSVINVTGNSQNQILTSVSFVILLVGLILAMLNYREQNAGFMSYGEGLGLGALLSAIIGLLTAAFNMFYIQFIDNTIITQALDKVRSDMEARGMDDSQIDQALAMSQKFMTPGIMFALGIFGFILVGFILSLIIAIFIRKDKPVFE